MTIICSIEKFKKALDLVEHVVVKNTTLPILTNILLRAEKNILFFEATNLEIGVITSINAKIEKEGRFVMPTQGISSSVGMYKSDENLTITQEGAQIIFSIKNNTTKIQTQDASDFPLIPQKKKEQTPLVLNNAFVQKALRATVFATAASETRPELTGIFIAFDEKKIRFAATDSFRLVEATVPLEEEPQGYGVYKKQQSIIIPKNTCIELLRVLEHTQEPVHVFVEENQIFFISGLTTIVSRLIDGTYPDYEQIIPQTAQTDVFIIKEDFSQAIKTSSIFSSQKTPEVTLDIKQKECTIEAASERGSHTTTLAVDAKGEDQHVVVNPRYILEGLAPIEGDDLQISLTNERAPILFTQKNNKKNDQISIKYRYIVMPVKSAG